MNFGNFLTTPFLQNTSGWLLLWFVEKILESLLIVCYIPTNSFFPLKQKCFLKKLISRSILFCWQDILDLQFLRSDLLMAFCDSEQWVLSAKFGCRFHQWKPQDFQLLQAILARHHLKKIQHRFPLSICLEWRSYYYLKHFLIKKVAWVPSPLLEMIPFLSSLRTKSNYNSLNLILFASLLTNQKIHWTTTVCLFFNLIKWGNFEFLASILLPLANIACLHQWQLGSEKSCFKSFAKFTRKYWYRVLYFKNFIYEESPTHLFSCELCEIF